MSDFSALWIVVGGLMSLLALGVFFLVMRRFVLWYWKINRGIALLESIDESLRALPAVREMRAAAHRRRAT